jgi:hypothetical protein
MRIRNEIQFYMHKNKQLLIIFFWVKSPCGLVGRNQHFEEVCCLHLQGQRWLLPTNPYGDLTEKNIIRIFTAVKILQLTNRITDITVLGCDIMWMHRPVFQRNILSPFSGLKIEMVCSSEMLVSTCKSI